MNRFKEESASVLLHCQFRSGLIKSKFEKDVSHFQGKIAVARNNDKIQRTCLWSCTEPTIMHATAAIAPCSHAAMRMHSFSISSQQPGNSSLPIVGGSPEGGICIIVNKAVRPASRIRFSTQHGCRRRREIESASLAFAASSKAAMTRSVLAA